MSTVETCPRRQGRSAALAVCALAVSATLGLAAARPVVAEARKPAVEITGWGIVDHLRTVGTAPSDTLVGRNNLIDPAVPVEIAETTLDIPACLGTRFGILFRATDAKGGRLTPITVRIRHPEQVAPDGRRSSMSQWPTEAGGQPRYTGWRFEQPFEVVTGDWTISIEMGGRTVVEKTFTVRRSACALTS